MKEGTRSHSKQDLGRLLQSSFYQTAVIEVNEPVSSNLMTITHYTLDQCNVFSSQQNNQASINNMDTGADLMSTPTASTCSAVAATAAEAADSVITIVASLTDSSTPATEPTNEAVMQRTHKAACPKTFNNSKVTSVDNMVAGTSVNKTYTDYYSSFITTITDSLADSNTWLSTAPSIPFTVG